ncbi:MAG: glycerol-3-phosphate dehydrogenase/oxidase [bacterium]
MLVIGGGVTGAGVALDAATRGLSVALVEAHDLAFGTSRWSSKLVHGGLRYLAHGDVAVAWESAVERRYLMATVAPHLIRALPHVIPAFDDTPARERALVRTGLAAADALRIAARTPTGLLGRSRALSADRVAELVPGIDRTRLAGGSLHWDGQLVDDARLVISLARTAARHGARIITRARAVEAASEGARVHDVLEGGEFDVRARAVILATGIWTAELDPTIALTTSRGSHALLRPEALGSARAALTVAVPGERGRYAFALPTVAGPVIAGITDIPQSGPVPDVPVPDSAEISDILAWLSAALERPLTPADVLGTYAGLRPLVLPEGRDEPDRTDDISRRHIVSLRDDGVVTVAGGKLTTYRRMAQDAVDLASAAIEAAPCRTRELGVVGAQPYRTPPPPGVPLSLVRRYGAEAPRVAARALDAPALLEPLDAGAPAHGIPIRGVDVVHAVTAEGALTVEDILDRRTRASLVPEDAARVRARVAEIAQALDPAIH